ncbi:hypothetical protein B7R21_18535 [Subtercola boreus]|uniref:Uncharacterized protein n=1 Tax=Subtercola boreus TaxID=120213 RepID=A0A3E0VAA0_9MICO|nr:hypothetical protein B7R21_18535 [Subtercola boreus]
MLLLSVSLITTAVILQIQFGQVTDGGGLVCTTNAFSGVTASCMYPDGWTLSKTIQAFAPGAFTAGAIGILLVLMLRGINYSLAAHAAQNVPPMRQADNEGADDVDRFRRPSQSV